MEFYSRKFRECNLTKQDFFTIFLLFSLQCNRTENWQPYRTRRHEKGVDNESFIFSTLDLHLANGSRDYATDRVYRLRLNPLFLSQPDTLRSVVSSRDYGGSCDQLPLHSMHTIIFANRLDLTQFQLKFEKNFTMHADQLIFNQSLI